MTSKDLAKTIGVTGARVRQILKGAGIAPGPRGSYDPVQSLAAIAKHYRKAAAETGGDYTRERTLLTKARRLKTEEELAVLRKQYVLRASVNSTFDVCARTTMTVLRQLVEVELPPKVLGLQYQEIAAHCQQTVDRVCETMRNHNAYENQKDQTETANNTRNAGGDRPHRAKDKTPESHSGHPGQTAGA